MSALQFWTTIIILYQTIICLVISWLTLSCRLSPEPSDLYELTLMKLLYLYDPEACGQIYFYNHTTKVIINVQNNEYNNIVWLSRNEVASGFRSKIKVSLALHIIWSFFGIVNLVMTEQPCGFYAVLVPFTITGLAMIVSDLAHGTLFLIDAKYTGDESAIFRYISDENHSFNYIYMKPVDKKYIQVVDTSWIAVLLAYISFRGVVQLIVNFWIVKDNYFEGVEVYRRLEDSRHTKNKLRPNN